MDKNNLIFRNILSVFCGIIIISFRRLLCTNVMTTVKSIGY